MKQSTPPKNETLRELKIRQIEYLRKRFGSSQLADLLEREVSEDSQPKEKRLVGTVAPKK